MKYAARVTKVLRPGIQKIGEIVDGEVRPVADLPLPSRVEIIPDGEGHFMLYRYTSAGTFCGDTWHETLKDAFGQATFEYGLGEPDFLRVE